MRWPKSRASGEMRGGGAFSDYAAWMRAGGCSAATLKLRLCHLERFAKRYDVMTATTAEVVEWLEQPGWRPATRASVRASLRSFFKWAQEEGLRPDNPAARTRPIRQPERPVKEAPMDAIEEALESATPRDRLALSLAAFAGLRRAEIANLHADNIDLDRGMLEITGKGGKVRRVPIHPRLLGDLAEVKARGGYAFLGADGWSPVTVDGMGKRLARLLPGKWTAHSLRHAYAGNVYRASKDIRAVQQLLGHSSISTTEQYTRVDEDDLRAAVGMWSS